MVWLGQLFVSPLVSFCLPTCFLTRLLGWVLARDGLARSALSLPTCLHLMLSQDSLAPALCLPTCVHLSPLFPHALAGLDAVTRWAGSVSSLSPHSFPCFSPRVSSLACWAGCCHEMVWLDQPFVSPLVRICLPTCFLTRLLGWMLSRDGLALSALCPPSFLHLSPH